MTTRRFLAHLAAGLALRLVLAGFWNGSYDVYTLVRFAGVFQQKGLWELYADGGRVYHFHPAVVLLYAVVLFLFSGLLNLPLHLAVKLPALAGDLLSAGALRAARPADPAPFLLFWWNPVSLLGTCYHGNFDSLHTALTLLASLLLVRAGRERLAGLAWGGAIVLKKVPVLWAPALLASAPGRPARRALLLWGALPAGAAFLLVLLLAPERANVLRAFTYTARGYEGTWGLAALLSVLAPASALTRTVFAAAPLVLVAAALLLVPRFRRLPPWRAVLLQVLVLYLLSAGFGLQYLCWALPFLALAGRRVAVPFGLAATVHLSLAYLQGASKSFVNDLRFPGNPWNDVHAALLSRIAPAAMDPAWDRLLLATALVLWLVTLWTALEASRPDAPEAPAAAGTPTARAGESPGGGPPRRPRRGARRRSPPGAGASRPGPGTAGARRWPRRERRRPGRP